MAPSSSTLALLSAALLVIAVLYQSLSLSPPPPPPAITLTYFDAPGRAEATRVALRLGGVAFTDERLARDAFARLKPTLPYGQVPVATVDGETFAESQAILRFAGRVAGLFPANDALATLLVDELLTAVDEVNENHITPTRREKDPTKQRQMRDAAVAGPLPAALEKLDARVQFVAALPFFRAHVHQIFLHEVAVWRLVSMFQSGTLDHIPSTITDAYAALNAAHAKVAAAIEAGPTEAAERKVTPQRETIQRPASLKLSYFDITGRAEPIRLALHIGGVHFEDERLARDAFLARKPTLPYGQVPVLTVDGVDVAQTFALLRFAGSLCGLYPVDDAVAALKVDELIARVEGVYYALYPSGREPDADKKRVMREQLAADRLPTALALLDKRVTQWKPARARFVLGDAISVADLALFHLVQFFQGGLVDFVPASVLDAHETLLAVNAAVLAHPRVVEWYARGK